MGIKYVNGYTNIKDITLLKAELISMNCFLILSLGYLYTVKNYHAKMQWNVLAAV